MKRIIIQIFGKKNCNLTKKAERFFKERNIKVQFINVLEKLPSKGEFSVITKKISMEELLDIDGNEYKKRNLKYMVYDTEELLLENPILLKTPIVRNNNEITLGYCPEIWETFIKI
ncbi:MAG: arsenate reductase family protein [Fusobacteriaceae bacterium]